MLDDFLLRALLAGAAVALAAGPLGCVVVWRRMSYFGDTIAHGALPGVALGIALGFNPVVGVLGVAVLVALAALYFRRGRRLPNDAILGMLSHSALSIGLIGLTFMGGVRVDLTALLFGDILAISWSEVWATFAGSALVLALLLVIWRKLVAATVDEDLARAEGVPVTGVSVAFMLLVAGVVALSMKIVGVLLVTALLVIPAVTARRLARSPEGMAALAPIIGVGGVAAGLALSSFADTPSGPSIVVAEFGFFLAATIRSRLRGDG
ncbi:MAG: metal ABC transporter permease [Rhizobiales bacterium]|nr:metal ABC transporter permease [Hyphomicrobiales bacterium]